LGYTIDAWIEYDDTPERHPERAGQPPFSVVTDNSISLEDFVSFRYSKDYRLFAVLAGIHRSGNGPGPLFPLRGGLPPNVSGHTVRRVSQLVDPDDPILSWLTYPEIEQAMAHMKVQGADLSLASNLMLDLMQSIEKRLGKGHSRLIFYIWY